jgi:uncharacterized protein YdhG (YjbR/CyaY superfamily)
MTTKKPANIDEYISSFGDKTKKALEQVRAAIKKVAPDAEETISYAIPCFKLNGKHLIYFAGYKHHIGLYPVQTENKAFEKDLFAYKTSGKGTLQLPLDKAMPSNLITKIVKFRIKENLEKAEKKKTVRKTTNR